MEKDKRIRILDAALRLFVEFGFHGTPTSKIAKEAGIANGTLFHYFSTKDDLVMALYVHIKKQMAESMAFRWHENDALKDIMKNVYVSTLYWALDNKLEFKFVEQFNSSPFLSLIAPEEVQKQVQFHYDLIQRAIDEKWIKPMPVDFIFTLVMSNVYGLNQYLLSHTFTKAEQQKYINDTFDMLWDMIS